MVEQPSAVLAYIGLGSNLDNPRQQVERALAALAALPATRLLRQSRWYQSAAIGPGAQPDYINGAALIATELDPHTLLLQLQAIEAEHGRQRLIRWGARTLDLDLLLYGAQQIHTDTLQVPHPRLQERNFVLYPLADLSPDLLLPDGTALTRLLAHCDSAGLHPLTT